MEEGAMEFFLNPRVILNAVIFFAVVLLIILLSIQNTLNQILNTLKKIRQTNDYSEQKRYSQKDEER